MSARADGGQAFPARGDDRFPRDSYNGQAKPGMTLRDYFAAAAMAAVWTKLDPKAARDISVTQTAKAAYEIADAMLTVRDGR